jgi:ubiquinone/menaquinone biosynthesis C-methylase UbiE
MYTWEQHEERMLRKIGFTFSAHQSVLDVGCGGEGERERGSIMSYVIAQQAGRVIGIDIEPSPAWRAMQLKLVNLEFQVADACRAPFLDDTFDVVFAKDLLHHVPVPEQAIAEMERVTKRGGFIVIVESNRYNPIKYIFTVRILGHNHFSQGYFKQLVMSKLKEAEFKSFEDHYYP